MKPELTIKETYHDALLFASSEINREDKKKNRTNFFLTFAEYKVLHKLIHYGNTYPEITFQNKDIAKHTFLAETTVKDVIESLRRKGYINSQGDVFNNRLGYATKRTIWINWILIESIYNMIDAVPEVKEPLQPEEPKEMEPTPSVEKPIRDESNKIIRFITNLELNEYDKARLTGYVKDGTIESIQDAEEYISLIV